MTNTFNETNVDLLITEIGEIKAKLKNIIEASEASLLLKFESVNEKVKYWNVNN